MNRKAASALKNTAFGAVYQKNQGQNKNKIQIVAPRPAADLVTQLEGFGFRTSLQALPPADSASDQPSLCVLIDQSFHRRVVCRCDGASIRRVAKPTDLIG